MDFGLPNIDLERLPYIFVGLAAIVYTWLYIKLVLKKEKGYYEVVYKSLGALAIVPFWLFMIILTIYNYNPSFKELITQKKEPLTYDSIIIKNDTPETKYYYLLVPQTKISKSKNGDETTKKTKWRLANIQQNQFARFPFFSIAANIEKEIQFEVYSDAAKVYVYLINENGNKWKIGAPAQIYELTETKNYIFTKDLDESRILKLKTKVNNRITYDLLFYSIALIGLFYHLITAFTKPPEKKMMFLIPSLVLFVPCAWIELNLLSHIVLLLL